jgi:hypothetical protein
VTKKQSHFQLARQLDRVQRRTVELPENKNLYEKASQSSKVVKVLNKGSKWHVDRIVGGLDNRDQQFLEISDFDFTTTISEDFLTTGYILVDFRLAFEQGG